MITISGGKTVGREEGRHSTRPLRRSRPLSGPAVIVASRASARVCNRTDCQTRALTYGVLGVAGAGESLDDSVVGVGARELSGKKRGVMGSVPAPVPQERERQTDGVGLGAHLVDAKGKEADRAKHEEELGQGGRGLDLVDVWCPHALDVVVLGDLINRRGEVSRAVRSHTHTRTHVNERRGLNRKGWTLRTGSPKFTRSWLSHQPFGLRSCLLADERAG